MMSLHRLDVLDRDGVAVGDDLKHVADGGGRRQVGGLLVDVVERALLLRRVALLRDLALLDALLGLGRRAAVAQGVVQQPRHGRLVRGRCRVGLRVSASGFGLRVSG
jgi:hypothetical protein